MALFTINPIAPMKSWTMKTILRSLLCAASLLAEDAQAATFTVTVTNENGAGSLRQAILDANASPGADVIHFNIASAAKTIIPTNALPAITEPVTLDATTQPGFSNAPPQQEYRQADEGRSIGQESLQNSSRIG